MWGAILQQSKSNFRWLIYSRFFIWAVCFIPLLSFIYSIHAVSSWNSSVLLWNLSIDEIQAGPEDIIHALNSHSHETITGDSVTTDNELKYRASELIQSYMSTRPANATSGGLGYISFIFLPVLSFAFGFIANGREYRNSRLAVKTRVTSGLEVFTSKIVDILCTAILCVAFYMGISPFSMFIIFSIAGKSFTSATYNEIIYDNLGETYNLSNVFYQAALSVVILTFYTSLGTLFSEIFRGNSLVVSFAVATYYLLPLMGTYDPRNVVSAAGRDVFHFGSGFNPYLIYDPQLNSGIALFLLLLSLIISHLMTYGIRVSRVRNEHFMRLLLRGF